MRLNALALSILLSGLAVAAVAEEAEDPPFIARTRALLGEFAQIQTREEGLEVRSRLLAVADTLEAQREDVWASHCLERAGIIDYRFAEYDQAAATWDRGLEAARRAEDPKRIAALLNARASVAGVMGDSAGAIRMCRELLELRRQAGDVRGEGITWHNKGFSHLALFEYPEALESLTEAMRCHRESNNAFGLAGSRLALVSLLAANGQRAEALAMADSAVAAAERIEAPDLLSASLSTQAMYLHHDGRLEDSIRAFERAQAIADRAGLAEVSFSTAVDHADALISAGRPDEAISILERVGANPRSDPATLPIVRGIHGRALLAVGDFERAASVLEEGAAAFNAMQDSLSSAVSQADALAASLVLTQLTRLYIRRGEPERAWGQLEDGAARTLRRAVTGAASIRPLVEIQDKLRELDAVLLSYGNADVDGTVATLTSPHGVVAVEIRYPRSMPVDLARLARLIASGAPDEACAPILQQVSDAFLGPLDGALEPGPTRCIIVPGSFAGLAFESLPWGDGSLGDAFAVSYSPSASVLLALEERSSSAGTFLALADPSPAVGDGLTTLALRGRAADDTPLPEARVEVERIAPRRAHILLGSEASRRGFLDNVGDASVVHLATHALIDSRHPDHSMLVLYSDDPEQAGVTAGEISQLPLHSDLVSLSGCQTAGGYTTGEGHFGLTRAFLVAGARSVVSSWWDVEDGAARRFMELFYQGLRKGVPRDQAVRQARTTMREEGYPYRDRAAFAITGAVSGSIPVLAGVGERRLGGWLPGAVVAGVVTVLLLLMLRRRNAH